VTINYSINRYFESVKDARYKKELIFLANHWDGAAELNIKKLKIT